MTTIITRLYPTRERAETAVAALKAKRFVASSADLFTGGAGQDDAALHAGITKAGVSAASAQTLVAKLKEGGTAVIAVAPFGNAIIAMDTLDSYDPIDSGLKRSEVFVPSQDPPMVHNRYLPILLDSDTMIMSGHSFPTLTKTSTPFQSLFGIPSLSKGGGRAGLMTGRLFSGSIGLPMLTANQSPRAKLMGSKTFSASVGVPTLTHSDAERK
ncbi:MAG: hypothetical protein WCH83_05240 [Alphaproteobacteria bacterium]|jgi:hypothetical protein